MRFYVQHHRTCLLYTSQRIKYGYFICNFIIEFYKAFASGKNLIEAIRIPLQKYGRGNPAIPLFTAAPNKPAENKKAAAGQPLQMCIRDRNPIVVTSKNNSNRISAAGYEVTPGDGDFYYNERIFNLHVVSLEDLAEKYQTIDQNMISFLKYNQKGRGSFIVSGSDMGVDVYKRQE